MRPASARRRTLRTVLVVAVALATSALTGMAPASAGDAVKIKTFENFGYVPGPHGGVVLNWGFAPRRASVAAGGQVKLTNATQSGEAHTASVVSAADVPRTIGEIMNCAVCNDILAKHDPDNNGQPPFVLSVNAGAQGLNTEGDSRLLLPGASAFANVTAPAGTTLHYICAIHPWMQAMISVT